MSRMVHSSIARRSCLCLLAGILTAAVLLGCGQAQGLHRVIRVYDGDTVGLSNGEKVRLIGIDCPESYESDKLRRDSRRSGESIAKILAKGRRASDFTRNMALNKNVIMEFDAERRDKYGRVLAYVWIRIENSHLKDMVFPDHYVVDMKDGHPETFIFLNATIMKAGFAQPMIIPPNTRHARSLRRHYDDALEAGRGLFQ